MNNKDNTFQHTTKSIDSVLGIILDASCSMQKNWKNHDGKEMPKIEVLRDALNKQFKEISSTYGTKKGDVPKTKIFCIGMGFILPMKLRFISIGNGNETPLNKPPVLTKLNITCDLLALSEIVPSNEILNNIRERLDLRWNGYAAAIVNKEETNLDVYALLKNYIQQVIQESARNKLRKGWRVGLATKLEDSSLVKFKLFQDLLSRLNSHISYWQEKIDRDSKIEAERYFENILQRSNSIFEGNKQNYTTFIIDQLNNFASDQCKTILEMLALGYSVENVIGMFNEEKAITIAQKIYGHLDKDVKSSISVAWNVNRAILLIVRKKLGATLDMTEVKNRTERCIQKQGWDILKPFVKSVVSDIFIKNFEEQAKNMLPYWLEIAERREVTRSLKQIVNILPDTSEKLIYSNEYMFGATPMDRAMDRATQRLLDKSQMRRQKTLLIVSDGEFETSAPELKAEMLKKAGVTIICCYISSNNIMPQVLSRLTGRIPKSAKTLFEMSSGADENREIAVQMQANKIELPDKLKLFVQINHSDILEKIINSLIPS